MGEARRHALGNLSLLPAMGGRGSIGLPRKEPSRDTAQHPHQLHQPCQGLQVHMHANSDHHGVQSDHCQRVRIHLARKERGLQGKLRDVLLRQRGLQGKLRDVHSSWLALQGKLRDAPALTLLLRFALLF